ncbi:MAG: glucosyltransferase domain-containing protein [Candidatus Saccharibacteria bacterium]
MRKILSDYKKELISLLSNRYLLLIVVITIILGYGFVLTNPSINPDDSSFLRYFGGGELIAQGRFFPAVLNQLLGGVGFTPFWLAAVCIILMVLAGLLYCCLFKRITNNKLNKICYILFIPIFISYPLINEIFIFNTALLSIGIGYLLTVISIICIYEYLINNKRLISLVLVPIALMTVVVSTYESFVSVFVLGLAMVAFLQYFYNRNDKKLNIKYWLRYVLVFAGVAAIAIIIEYIATNLYIDTNHITRSVFAQTSIKWVSNGVIGNIHPFLSSVYHSFIKIPYNYLSITILQVIVAVFVIYMTTLSIIKKNYWLLLFSAFLILSAFSLIFVQGVAGPYRTCQAIAPLVAFLVIIIYDQTPKKIKPLIFIAALYLLTMQTYDLTKWFYNENMQYQQERTVMINVANTIKSNFDDKKPVVFLGEYTQPPNIEHAQSNGISFINWGMGAFYELQTELFIYLEMHGYYFVRPNAAQYIKACDNMPNMDRWPKKNSIIDYQDMIVVRF